MRTTENIETLNNDMISYVDHWGYDDGKPEESINGLSATHGRASGYYCWIYPKNKDKFEQWMTDNCPNAVYNFRFNSGSPMYTTHFSDSKEAMIFKLTFLG